MIPQDYITAWRHSAPWLHDEQVEQDLLICRALVEIYNHPALSNNLIFRGGTALHKLFLKMPARYSVDIDLVQIKPEPIGPTITAIRNILDPILGNPKRIQGEFLTTLKYKFKSEQSKRLPQLGQLTLQFFSYISLPQRSQIQIRFSFH